MRIVFWQNMLAMITAPCIKALSKMDGIEVVWVVVESLSDERKKIGWDLPDAGDAEIVCAPNRKKIEDLVRDRADESVHIFSGHRTYALLGYAFSICRRTNARIGFFTEGFDGRGIKGIFRFLLCYLYAMANRRRVDFILAVGTYAVRWFAGCG